MEKSRIFVITVISIGVLAILFQAIGFFAPAWMSYDMSVNSDGEKMKVSVDMGLWVTTGCVNMASLGGEQCKSMSNDDLRSSMGVTSAQSQDSMAQAAGLSGLKFLDDFDKVKVLATLGGCACVAGLVFLCLFARASGSKNMGIVSAVCWGLGSILVFAAVGLQAHTNSNFDHAIEILKTVPQMADLFQLKTHFPWAILMSGFGAGLGTVVAGLITFKACYMNDPNAPALWNRFNNQAV